MNSKFLYNTNPSASKNGKSIAFTAETENEPDTKDLGDEALALLTKNFKKILKGFNIQGQGQSSINQSKSSNFFNQKPTSNSTRSKSSQSTHTGQSKNTSSNSGKSLNHLVQYRECEWYGHIHVECPTYLKRKKSMIATK